MNVLAPQVPQPADDSARRAALALLRQGHHRLLLDPERHRTELETGIEQAVAEVGGDSRMATSLKDFVLGAGHLQRFLDDAAVTEIMGTGPKVFIERGGTLQEAEGFSSAEEAFELAERMALRRGERFQLACPILDFAWLDGSRVSLIHPILTGGDVAITIRKPNRSRPLDLSSLVEAGMLSKQAAAFLTAAVGQERRNLLFTGAQGSGKTTLLQAVLHEALRPTPLRRIVLIEDTPEIRLNHRHVLAMRAHAPAHGEMGAHVITLADLTKASKRHRPDLVVVGEVRGAEGVDLIALAQSENVGIASTLHIGKPEDLAERFWYFSTLAGLGTPKADIASWVYSSFHLVCHLDKGLDGRHQVVRIVRLESETQRMTDLFRHNPDTDTLEEASQ